MSSLEETFIVENCTVKPWAPHLGSPYPWRHLLICCAARENSNFRLWERTVPRKNWRGRLPNVTSTARSSSGNVSEVLASEHGQVCEFLLLVAILFLYANKGEYIMWYLHVYVRCGGKHGLCDGFYDNKSNESVCNEHRTKNLHTKKKRPETVLVRFWYLFPTVTLV